MTTETTARRVTIDQQAYFDLPGVSQSMLKLYLDDPGKFRDRYVLGIEQQGPEARHFQWGKDFERLVFADELPGVLIPEEVLARSERDGKVVLSRRGAAWTEWRDRILAEQPDARLLKAEEWESQVQPYLLARDNLREHARAMKLLRGERHVVITWEDEETGLPCKCQLDTVSQWRILTDLKTTRDARPTEFAKSVWNFGYHIQAEWYRRAWERLTGELWPFTFVAVQTSPSYAVEAFDLAPIWYDMAQQQIREGMRRLARAYERDDWHTPTFGSVVVLEPPAWAVKQVLS